MSSFLSVNISTRESWYPLADQFGDLRDQKSFDPSFHSESLEHFEPMVLRVFARANSL
jgi:hypothetical protein